MTTVMATPTRTGMTTPTSMVMGMTTPTSMGRGIPTLGTSTDMSTTTITRTGMTMGPRARR